MSTRKKAPKKPKAPAAHFAVGLPVFVREGTRPAGWQDTPGSKWSEFWDGDDYRRSYQIQSVAEPGVAGNRDERCTYEVDGWFWYPEDLEIAYHRI